MLAKRHQISFEFRPDLLLACRLHAGVFEQLELRSVRFEVRSQVSLFRPGNGRYRTLRLARLDCSQCSIQESMASFLISKICASSTVKLGEGFQLFLPTFPLFLFDECACCVELFESSRVRIGVKTLELTPGGEETSTYTYLSNAIRVRTIGKAGTPPAEQRNI